MTVKRKAEKVMLIGWDAADWKIINPLLDSGQMPSLAKLIENGVMGKIATLDPPLSPMLWTSIATGKTADKHGILGFVEPDPNTGKVRPATVTSRKVKAIWNILQQNGIKPHVVSWWPSHPAEPIDGVYVSNFFAKVNEPIDKPWPLPENSVHPKELADVIAACRIHPDEITAAHIIPFVPAFAKIDQEKDGRIPGIAKMLASVSSAHNVATWILENKEWEFLGVYLNEMDHFCHTFMKFHPPKLKGMDEELFENYKHVIDGIYRYYDMMLGRVMELAGEHTTFVLVSDHGFHSDHLRPTGLPTDPAAPAMEHAPYGIIVVSGPGIKKDERVYGASLLDVTPTLLSLFGLPVGKDMDGRVLSEIFDENTPVEFIESWETIEGNTGQHPGEVREDPWAAQQALQQLAELGYIEAAGEDQAKMAERISRESRFYLARVFLSTQRIAQAIPILEELIAEDPDTIRYALRLAFAYQQTGKTAAARKTIDAIRSKQKKHADLPHLDYLEGSLLFSEGRPRKALEILRRAENEISHLPGLYIVIGFVYVKTQNWREAENAFIRALSIDPENARAHYGLALASLRLDKIEIAIDEALNAIGLRHFHPAAHYHLGEALYRIGEFERAAEAFEVCVSMTPGNKRAHFWLIKIYKENLKLSEKAKAHEDFVTNNIQGTITIISGLPRSGTSMLMQMVRAGGMEIFTDDNRIPDENNPKGYLEEDRVKRLHLDNKWLGEVDGKALKVVAPLLQFLPIGFRYKIVFVKREMNEVLLSQQKMTGKKTDGKTYPVVLADAFTKQLEKAEIWIKAQPHAEVLYVEYADIISDPLKASIEIAAFLGNDMDAEAMAEIVDPDLYRNRKSI
ncbi:hypothetical protein BH09BAC5_BH09BAC5_00710 [soil metagenome]